MVRRLARAAGLDCADRLSPHSLRHAFVTLALDAGVSLRTCRTPPGYADPRTTRRYDPAQYTSTKRLLTLWPPNLSEKYRTSDGTGPGRDRPLVETTG